MLGTACLRLIMYYIPSDVIEKFLTIGTKNVSFEDSNLVETLAFLVGYKKGTDYYATHIIFPEQHGEAFKVEDKGKIYCRTMYFRCDYLVQKKFQASMEKTHFFGCLTSQIFSMKIRNPSPLLGCTVMLEASNVDSLLLTPTLNLLSIDILKK